MLSCLRWIPSLKKLKIGQSRLNARLQMCCAGSYINSSNSLAEFRAQIAFVLLYTFYCRMLGTYIVVCHSLSRVSGARVLCTGFSQGEFPQGIVSCLNNSNNADKTKYALLVRCSRSGYEAPAGFGTRGRARGTPRAGRLQTRLGCGGGVPLKN